MAYRRSVRRFVRRYRRRRSGRRFKVYSRRIGSRM